MRARVRMHDGHTQCMYVCFIDTNIKKFIIICHIWFLMLYDMLYASHFIPIKISIIYYINIINKLKNKMNASEKKALFFFHVTILMKLSKSNLIQDLT